MAGPYCGMMLGDMGAEVIKIENPRQKTEARGGYPYVANESVIFLMLHRNKKSVTLDLKNPVGARDPARSRQDRGHVDPELPTGLMKKLEATYDELREVNPALIYGSLSGYGNTGPKADWPGVNMIALAESGLAATTIDGDNPPIPLGYAFAMSSPRCGRAPESCSAYVRRLKTGKGQEVDMSLLEAGLSLMMSPVAQHFHVKGDWVAQTGHTDSNAPSGFFRCSDGLFLTVFASYPALWDRFVEVMNLQHLKTDDRFATRDARTVNARALHDIIAPIYAQKPVDYWVELLVKAGVQDDVDVLPARTSFHTYCCADRGMGVRTADAMRSGRRRWRGPRRRSRRWSICARVQSDPCRAPRRFA